ncbi:MAG: hypothetical protein HOH65_01550 [Rhodospirillaceae bacterium]|jgi:phosphonoacetate hydrolase|nr:hypothetical protein [Rhodospirillaceae bacterium]
MVHSQQPRPRFLVVVFDGLRRDLITPDLMPALHAFRQDWCDFPNARSTFPSETRVQVSGLVTGSYPGGHGIMANAFYDPALGFDGPMDTSDSDRMAHAETVYGGVLAREDLGGILHREGRRYAALTAGKKGNARLLNTRATERGQPTYSIWGADISSPAAGFESIEAKFGPVPEQVFPNVAVTEYATDVLLDHFIETHDPDVLIHWFNEPDLSFHYRGIGTPESLETLTAVDRGFARILDWWSAEGQAAGWQIITASDHGQITVTGQVDVTAALTAAGFAVGHAIGPDVDIAIKRGYSGQITVRDRTPRLLRRVVDWMHDQEWAGMMFTRDGIDGTLPMASLNVLNNRSPDLNYTLKASDAVNEYGYPGTCLADNGDIPVGGGMHGGLHPIELNGFLAAGGDLFRRNTLVETPCGIVDVAPTMLAAMGIASPDGMTGRQLGEALLQGEGTRDWREEKFRSEARDHAQQLTIAHVDGGLSPYIQGGERLA